MRILRLISIFIILAASPAWAADLLCANDGNDSNTV
jgi:hypothetical protein